MRIKVARANCTGCRLCQQICAITRYGEINPKKAAIHIGAEFPVPGVFVPVLCVPCPEEAIERTGDAGAYVIDVEKCTNCGVCIDACPIGAMRSHADAPTPIKCDLCLKCTEVCNTGALTVVDTPRLSSR
jgi:carbon-monoxide dehydrogenase iron sulfur subunit